MSKTKLLVLGASGMLGNALVRYFGTQEDIEIFGTARSHYSIRKFPDWLQKKVLQNVDVENSDHLIKVFSCIKPDVVINCTGVVKQLAASEDPLSSIPINSLVPHRLARLAASSGARLVHLSTDCVFSGANGNYVENDLPDGLDLYARSKLIGEVDYTNAITLRTSIIGHELNGARSLVSWFLSQSGEVKGFRKAIFSGLPTIEIAKVIHKFVLPNHALRGLYHLSSDPINKFELLSLVAAVYGKVIDIIPDDSLVIDRSLDSSKFRLATGYSPEPWPKLIKNMRDFELVIYESH